MSSRRCRRWTPWPTRWGRPPRTPPPRRVPPRHPPPPNPAGLKNVFEKMSAVDALLYKMVPTASQSGEEIPALLLLDILKRRDVAVFCAGATGAWTRLVAPRLGAPVGCGR